MTWEAAKFLADSHFRFFPAFARGILGGILTGPAMAVTSIGATAPGLVALAPWAANTGRDAAGSGRLAGKTRAHSTRASLAPRPRGSQAQRDHAPTIKGQISSSRSKVKAPGPGYGTSQAPGPGYGTSQAGRTSAK